MVGKENRKCREHSSDFRDGSSDGIYPDWKPNHLENNGNETASYGDVDIM
jgi:hypothetical protein